MTSQEIIELGVKLGLTFNEKTNYPDMLKRNIVNFDGCNGQRFTIDGSWDEEFIYEKIGLSLIKLGARRKCMQINRALSIMSDTLEE